MFRPAAPVLKISDTSFPGLGGHDGMHKFEAILNSNVFVNSPRWDRSEPNPPLSANAAMVAADLYIKSLVAKKQFPSDYQISHLYLAPFDSTAGYWFWVVNVDGLASPSQAISLDVGVRMDGTVVNPIRTERVDLGWPLPNADFSTIVRPELTDLEIARQFVEHVNPERRYAGHLVTLMGQIEDIDPHDPHRCTRERLHLVLNDGTTLIADMPGGWAVKYGRDLEVSGRLTGYRDLGEKQEAWEGLQLYPGIRITRSMPSSKSQPADRVDE